MKKKKLIIIFAVLFILLIILLSVFIYIYNLKLLKEEKKNIIISEYLIKDIEENKYLSDYITLKEGKLIDKKIEIKELGKHKIIFKYKNKKGRIHNSSIILNIVDKTPPYIRLGGGYYKEINSEDNLVDKIICVDNYDIKPNCFIEGKYDLNKEGIYKLVFKAVDKSGNSSKKPFNLHVYKKEENNKPSTETKTYFNEVYNFYKDEPVKVGIDVSVWQGKIDFEKIKKAGVEFIFIRIGGTKGDGIEHYLDKNFDYNFKEAKKHNIPVGIYFHSYSNTEEQVKESAKWIIKHLNGETLELPIIFDWEDWLDFNTYHFSLRSFNDMANTFIKTINNYGYIGMLYSSKSYLMDMWNTDKPVWLAHYTGDYKVKSSYEGKYKYWQLCNDGIIDGIEGYVDIDLMFE